MICATSSWYRAGNAESASNMACDYCMGNCPHDSTHEGVMDWYEHYMAVSTREVTDAMQRDSIAARKAGKDRGDL